jgi:hypothetical protein
MSGDNDEFAWAHDNPAIVCFEQPSTAVYRNPVGAIVIRQERGWSEEEDPFVWIQPQSLRCLIIALQRELAADEQQSAPSQRPPESPRPPPKPNGAHKPAPQLPLAGPPSTNGAAG